MKTKAKPKRINRTEKVLLRLKPDERAQMEAEAKARGLGISAWIRMTVLEALKKIS